MNSNNNNRIILLNFNYNSCDSSAPVVNRGKPVIIFIEEDLNEINLKVNKMDTIRRNNQGEDIPVQVNEITSTNLVSLNINYCNYSNSIYPVTSRPSIHSNRSYLPRMSVDNYVRNRFHENNRTEPTIHDVKANKIPGSTRYALLSVLCIFICSFSALLYVYTSFPNLEESEKQFIKIPFNIEEAKQLGIVLDKYKDRYFFEVLFGVFITYIFLQTFAIPGSLFLSILSGFLFPFFLALVLVCVCSAVGASLCYLLSQLLGRKLVKYFFPERAEKWAIAVNKHRGNIFNYILFLRMTPFLPNWFINLTAPVIGVPLIPFALGTFIGVGPPSFVAIQAGRTLHKMTSTSGVFSWYSVILLGVFAILSIVPVLNKQRLREKFE